jgi:hypothetical protein
MNYKDECLLGSEGEGGKSLKSKLIVNQSRWYRDLCRKLESLQMLQKLKALVT